MGLNASVESFSNPATSHFFSRNAGKAGDEVGTGVKVMKCWPQTLELYRDKEAFIDSHRECNVFRRKNPGLIPCKQLLHCHSDEH